MIRHVNYIHYNPIKHGVARCPHAWPWSSFHRWVEEGYYKPSWLCDCGSPAAAPSDLMTMPDTGEQEDGTQRTPQHSAGTQGKRPVPFPRPHHRVVHVGCAVHTIMDGEGKTPNGTAIIIQRFDHESQAVYVPCYIAD